MSDLSAGLDSALSFAKEYSRQPPPKWRPPTGSEIRELRQAIGLSQPQFADRFGFSLSALRKWEQDVAEPEQVAAMVLRMIESDHEGVSNLVQQTRGNPEAVHS